MASRMFAAAKTLVIAGVLSEISDPGPDEFRRRVFLRIYGRDFSEEQQKNILAAATDKHPPTPKNE